MKTVKIAVIGKGKVGRALIGMLGERYEAMRRAGLCLHVVCIAGSSEGILTRRDRIPGEELIAFSRGGALDGRNSSLPLIRGWGDMALVAELRRRHRDKRVIMVDATAVDTYHGHMIWLDEGWGVVSANKLPLQRSLEEHVRLIRHGDRYRYEATVGAGLPIISTIEDLRASGDEILEIRAAPSGTIGFVITEWERKGVPVPDGLAEAQRLGYAESDPLADFSGVDVARKSEILARASGWVARDRRVELRPFEEKLLRRDFGLGYPGDPGENVEVRNLHRYISTITPQSSVIGLEKIGSSSPFAQLYGTDNLFVIRTKRQTIEIKGPGAGPEVTAGAMFSDILKVARSL